MSYLSYYCKIRSTLPLLAAFILTFCLIFSYFRSIFGPKMPLGGNCKITRNYRLVKKIPGNSQNLSFQCFSLTYGLPY